MTYGLGNPRHIEIVDEALSQAKKQVEGVEEKIKNAKSAIHGFKKEKKYLDAVIEYYELQNERKNKPQNPNSNVLHCDIYLPVCFIEEFYDEVKQRHEEVLSQINDTSNVLEEREILRNSLNKDIQLLEDMLSGIAASYFNGGMLNI